MTPTLLDRAPAVSHNSVEQGLLMASSKSERKTENIVRDELRRLGYYLYFPRLLL
jgi:hypothetical protein